MQDVVELLSSGQGNVGIIGARQPVFRAYTPVNGDYKGEVFISTSMFDNV